MILVDPVIQIVRDAELAGLPSGISDAELKEAKGRQAVFDAAAAEDIGARYTSAQLSEVLAGINYPGRSKLTTNAQKIEALIGAGVEL